MLGTLLLTWAGGLLGAANADDATPTSSKTSEAEVQVTFEQHVRPIFKAMCFHCHGEEDEKEGGLDLRLVRLMKSGGDSGTAIVPHDSSSSLLWQRIESDEMPDGPKKLTPEQKAVVRSWIDAGAQTARAEPENVEDARFSVEELEHWAFQAVEKPTIPLPEHFELSTPIDGFVARRLEEKGLPFSPRADRQTLIRRVTFDLTGLPPTSEEVEAFVNNESPEAYSRLVDRLLNSPQFGVRWGRHWLDVAGYAESDGGNAAGDTKRPHAWRYRDYVIKSFNRNKGIDTFIREQLAGDEMVEGDLDATNERQLELLTATSFLRMAPDQTERRDTLADRNMAAANTMEVVGSTLLGLTVHCAQCHDHKYDPIGIDDYYRFRAVFDPLFPLKDWQKPSSRLVNMTTAQVNAERERIEAKAKAVEDEINGRRHTHAAKIFENTLLTVPEDLRETARTAVETPADKRSAEQKELLENYPMVKPASFIAGFLVEYDPPIYRKFEAEMAKAKKIRATKPPLRMVMAAGERPGVVPTSAVFFRGNPEVPRDEVTPGELVVLTRSGREVRLPTNDPTRSTTGRRSAYAKQLTDNTHPLTGRVFVNRVWLHHIGRGLVQTPGDFGLLGATPSHPELLDWLADDFVRHGWNQKRLHRMIVLSTTYKQQSRRSPKTESLDPENSLLGRMNLRRLEAEAIRDAILSVTDKLDHRIGGPSAPVEKGADGKTIIGGPASNSWRRSAFIEVQRKSPLNMLATFDQPTMDPNCDLRQSSTVATQSLWFLNDELIVGRANDLAKLLFSEEKDNAQKRIERLFLRLFATGPTQNESQTIMDFLTQQEERFRADPDEEWQKAIKTSPRAPAQRALASLCQTLLASNRFLYVD